MKNFGELQSHSNLQIDQVGFHDHLPNHCIPGALTALLSKCSKLCHFIVSFDGYKAVDDHVLQ